jgi:hypothetical protein
MSDLYLGTFYDCLQNLLGLVINIQRNVVLYLHFYIFAVYSKLRVKYPVIKSGICCIIKSDCGVGVGCWKAGKAEVEKDFN